MNKIIRAAVCVPSAAAFVAVLPMAGASAVTTPPAGDGTIRACAEEFANPDTIIRVDFDGPVFGEASLLHRDCEDFAVPAGRYHFNSPPINNPCTPNTVLNVVFRRNGINYEPTSPTDFAANVGAGQETRVIYFCS